MKNLKTLLIAALLTLSSFPAWSNQSGQYLDWCQQNDLNVFQCAGVVYAWICEDGLNGVYVNSNPNFYQAWACEGDLQWCSQFPGLPGCPTPTQLPTR